MRVTHEIAAVIAQELISDKIQRCRHMATTIHIGEEISSIVDQKGIHPIFLADQPEFFHRSRRYFIDFGNDPPPKPALFLHAPLSRRKMIR
jgi:hypothetical protein